MAMLMDLLRSQFPILGLDSFCFRTPPPPQKKKRKEKTNRSFLFGPPSPTPKKGRHGSPAKNKTTLLEAIQTFSVEGRWWLVLIWRCERTGHRCERGIKTVGSQPIRTGKHAVSGLQRKNPPQKCCFEMAEKNQQNGHLPKGNTRCCLVLKANPPPNRVFLRRY